MDLIIPAYNIKPALAAKFEDKIAKIMHRKRHEEINRFRNEAKPPRLPEPEAKRTGSAKGRMNNPTDELVLKLLRSEELQMNEVSDRLGLSRQLTRAILERLYSRKLLVRRREGLFYRWRTEVEGPIKTD